MPTHDYIIANGTGAAVRADINLALSAIVSLNSSASEPATMYAYQLWADTALGLLKIRNSANSAWITLRQLDGDFSIVAVEDGLQATPSLTFTNDLNTGVFRSGADALAIVTGGQYAIACTSTQAVGIKTANPSTALHVAGNARVGADDATDAHLQIGKGATGNRNSYIDIVGDTTYTDYGLRVIRNNTGANATSELKHRGTGALNFTTQEAAAIVFNTTNSPQVTIDSSGRLLVGTSTNTLNINNTDKQAIVLIGDDTYGGLAITGYNGTSNPTLRGPRLTLQRSRGITDGSMTKVASGDLIGQISFRGADGTDFEVAATIEAYADGEFNTSSDATDSPGRLVFATTPDGASSPTERMRITNSGAIQVGATGLVAWTDRIPLQVGGGGSVAWQSGIADGNSTIFANNFYVGGGLDRAITTGYVQGIVMNSAGAGDVKVLTSSSTATAGANFGFTAGPYVAAGGTSWTSASDERLKNIIGPLANGLEKISNIRAVRFSWKDDPTGALNVGVIAQDVEAVLPEIINKSRKYGSDDNTEYLGVSYELLAPLLITALQEAKARIESLESKVAALESA